MDSAAVACPYLDTVNRTLLDFDFEPACSVTLTRGPHIYGCLVCGKFFRGRGRSTPAHTHSVESGHAVYVHLSRGTFHCLPDDYEVKDPSLDDIRAALHPTYGRRDVEALDTAKSAGLLARDLFGRRYLPGFVGLNNLNKTDYVNATVQALAHVRPLRDFFLRLGGPDNGGGGARAAIQSASSAGDDKKGAEDKKKKKRKRDEDRRLRQLDPSTHSPLVRAFGDLVRNMWSDRRFKSTVDPHAFVQAVSDASDKRYRVGRQAEAGEFLAWLMHQLHVGLGGTRKPGSSVIHDIFQGTVEVTTRQRRKRGAMTAAAAKADEDYDEDDDRAGSEDEADRIAREDDRAKRRAAAEEMIIDETSSTTRFLQLTLDIPEKPLFKDDEGGLVIPQEPLVSVLRKFDGETFCDATGSGGTAQKRRYRVKKLPDYLILHLNRFRRNEFAVEKNPTIVAFPVKNLDLGRYVFPDGDDGKKKSTNGKKAKPPTEEEVRSMSVKELRSLLVKHGRSDLAHGIVEKADLVEAVVDFAVRTLPDLLADKYDLVANVTHHIPAEVGKEERRDPLQEGTYRCHVRHGVSNKWYEIQDLHVEETMPQLIGISESYVMIFERKGVVAKSS